MAEKTTKVNEAVKAFQVRLIGIDGKQLGVVSNQQAKKMALDAGADLVEISPNAEPPVCKLMDYRKYLFDQNKQRQVTKKKRKNTAVKEMSFRPTTDVGDYGIKLNKIKNFIIDGHKVKITLKYRGRELSHKEIGMQLIDRLKFDLSEHVAIEQEAKFEGRQVVMLVSPKPYKKTGKTV